MKSPLTGKEMNRVCEKRIWRFRGEEYEYYHTSWECEDSGEQFTTDETDTAGFRQVTNQYRSKYGIPYTDEITEVRERYGISASKMSKILGIGTNQYRLYEQGEVPSVSNGRMIRSIINPKVMLDLVESSKNELSNNEYEKISLQLKEVIRKRDTYNHLREARKRIFCTERGAENGYGQLSLERLKNIMLAIIERCEEVWCTKMNKLLFYVDFLSYRERGYAMTGLTYRAIDYGPVPERWDRVYSEFDEIDQNLKSIGDYEGSVLTSNSKVESGILSNEDIQIIDKVCDKFGEKTSRELSEISHREDAWLKYHLNKGRISFEEAFSLKSV